MSEHMFDDLSKGRKHDPTPREAEELKRSKKKKRVAKKRGSAISAPAAQYAITAISGLIVLAVISAAVWFAWQVIQAYIT